MNRFLAGALGALNALLALIFIVVGAMAGYRMSQSFYYYDYGHGDAAAVGTIVGVIVGCFVAVLVCGFLAVFIVIKDHLAAVRDELKMLNRFSATAATELTRLSGLVTAVRADLHAVPARVQAPPPAPPAANPTPPAVEAAPPHATTQIPLVSGLEEAARRIWQDPRNRPLIYAAGGLLLVALIIAIVH